MISLTMALLLSSHVDLLGDKDSVHLCAAGFDLLADQAAAKGSDAVNVQIFREFSTMFIERLRELGVEGEVSLEPLKRRLPGGDPERAVMSKCGAIIGALRGNDTLLDAARKLDR